MQIPVDGIKVKKRIRENMGDISGLAASMKRLGQISPIVVSKKNELIAGGRRLEAARLLGWRTIDAVVSETGDDLTRLELEIEENTQRRDFTSAELTAANKRLARLKNPNIFLRIVLWIKRLFERIFGI